mgnify:FL=1
MAMPYIQMSLMPLATSKARQQVVLTMMITIFDEVLELKYGTLTQQNVKFPDIAAETRQAANEWSADQLMAMLDKLLDTSRSVMVNVSFQNIVESVTLEMLAIIKA